MNYIKYQIREGSPAFVICQYWHQQRTAQFKEMQAYAIGLTDDKAKVIIDRDGRLAGVMFKGDPPKDWVLNRDTQDNRKFYRPSRAKTKAAALKDVNKRFCSFRVNTTQDLCVELGLEKNLWCGFTVTHIQPLLISDDVVVLAVPNCEDGAEDFRNICQDDTTELLESEFVKLQAAEKANV